MNVVAIIDYGMSNLRSVARALSHVAGRNDRITITDRSDDIHAADRIVFPGQGAVGQCMENMRKHDLLGPITDCLKNKPFLGICLGLQSLMEWSDEDGGVNCLGFLSGKVVRFSGLPRDPVSGLALKVPHMGWNQVAPMRDHALWKDIPAGEYFYFVHSYHVVPARYEDIAATTEYGAGFISAWLLTV